MPRTLTLSRCSYGGPNSRVVLNGMRHPDGRRARKFFRSERAGEAVRKREQDILDREGTEGATLTPQERMAATVAIRKLGRFGLSLDEAVDHMIREVRHINRRITVGEAAEEFIAAKAKLGAKRRYLADLKLYLRAFAKFAADRPACDIRAGDIDAHLSALKGGVVSRNNRRRVLHVFFEYAKMRDYCTRNPVAAVAAAKAPPPVTRLFEPAEARALLGACSPQIVPAVAIALFAGLRQSEIAALDWSAVRIDRAHIVVSAGSAKTASRRVVPMQPNLAAWLAPHARASGPVTPKGMRYQLDAARIRAELFDPAKENINGRARDTEHEDGRRRLAALGNRMRHSFASYRHPILLNDGALAAEMGNSPAKVHRHYRELRSAEQAAQWWAIFPPAPAEEDAPTFA